MTLLHAIESCLRLSNIPPSRFGRDSVRDPRLVHDLRRGRQPGRRMEARVRMHIALVLEQVRAAEGGRAASASGGRDHARAAGAQGAGLAAQLERIRRNAAERAALTCAGRGRG
jgi:hypothetical protein